VLKKVLEYSRTFFIRLVMLRNMTHWQRKY